MAEIGAKKSIKDGIAPQPFVSTPLRPKTVPEHANLYAFYQSLASRFPDLKKRLFMAEMNISTTQFIQDTVAAAIVITATLELCLLIALSGMSVDVFATAALLLAGIFVFGYISFTFMMMQPNLKIINRGKRIDQDLLFAGRHILIELRSGLTLFDAMLGVSQDYGEVSKEFNKIVEKITLGVPATAALHDVADNSPSQYFRRLILQISNSLMSGSDLAGSMESVLDQISREQVIQVKAYGQKLNPIVMFFMLFGVIIPSLGVAFMILLLSFVGAQFGQQGSTLLVAVFSIVAIVQFIFLSMVESSRPSFDMV